MEIAILGLLGALVVAIVGWGYHIGHRLGKIEGCLQAMDKRLEAQDKRLNEIEHQLEHLIIGKGGD